MNKPTEKQIKFAKEIANKLDLELPKENTKQAYWKFINDNVSEYRTRMLCVKYMCEEEELDLIFGTMCWDTDDLW